MPQQVFPSLLMKTTKKELNINDLESVEQFKFAVFDALKTTKAESVINHFLNKLASDLNIPQEVLVKDYTKTTRQVVQQLPEIELPIVEKKEEKKVLNKTFNIKPKVFKAFDILIKHLISSKQRVLEYVNTLGNNLYIDSSLATYFEIINRIEIFYAEHDIMDSDDFISIMGHLDELNGTNQYSQYANKILTTVIANTKDNKEFQDCLKVIEKCDQDVSKTRLYNRAINSINNDDIKKFENNRKQNVLIMNSKEE